MSLRGGMTAWEGESNDVNGRLVAAVVGRDSAAAQACLEGGADPNTPAPDGLPVLCVAVAGFDHVTAEALLDGGADPDVVLPDGTTPLLRPSISAPRRWSAPRKDPTAGSSKQSAL